MSKGDCYVVSAKMILGDSWMGSRQSPSLSSSARLVHGMVKGQGQLEGLRYGHAWVEDGNNVYDYSNDREIKMRKDVYYAIGDIRERDLYKYSEEEARRWVLKTETWGPWESKGGVEPIRDSTVTGRNEIGIPGIRVPRELLTKMKEALSVSASAKELIESNKSSEEIIGEVSGSS